MIQDREHGPARGFRPSVLACRFGVGEAAAISAGTALSSTAATSAGAGLGTAGAAGVSTALGGTASLGVSLPTTATAAVTTGGSAAVAAPTISAGIPSLLGINLSPAAVKFLSAAAGLGGPGLGATGTAAKVAQGAASAGLTTKSALDQSKAAKQAERTERRRGEAEAQESLSRAQSVIAANEVGAAARGVVGGSGSVGALESANLRESRADQANIASNSAAAQSVYELARRRARNLGFIRASRSLFDAGTNATDFF